MFLAISSCACKYFSASINKYVPSANLESEILFPLEKSLILAFLAISNAFFKFST
ncbi:hypothetical protein NTHI1209_00339 [Haemophilus influenzae]|uniref:Uncharacterized protein n=1 Tax=Haemophilus influenzae TaxID=727 RepID=A0A158SV43_HAEIF|nr:hypothetical protein NTHI1209_00339 [Haemophilus influenzae]